MIWVWSLKSSTQLFTQNLHTQHIHTGAIKLGQVQATCQHYDFSLCECVSMCVCAYRVFCMGCLHWPNQTDPLFVQSLVLCADCLLLQNLTHDYLLWITMKSECVLFFFPIESDHRLKALFWHWVLGLVLLNMSEMQCSTQKPHILKLTNLLQSSPNVNISMFHCNLPLIDWLYIWKGHNYILFNPLSLIEIIILSETVMTKTENNKKILILKHNNACKSYNYNKCV